MKTNTISEISKMRARNERSMDKQGLILLSDLSEQSSSKMASLPEKQSLRMLRAWETGLLDARVLLLSD